MKVRVLSMLLSLAALHWVGPIQAQLPPLQAQPGNLKTDEIRRNAVEAEQELARQFTDFQKNLQALKNRLDRSADPSDKDRAVQLQKVLDKADSAGIRIKFARLQEHLRKTTFTLDDFKEAALKTEILAKDFAELVDLFDGKNSRLGEEIDATAKAIKALEDIIKTQKQLQAMTEQAKTEKNKLAKLQEDVTQDTKNLVPGKKEAKDPKNSEGGEAKDLKSQPKEGKGDDKKAETRDAGKKNQGEVKENGPKDSKDNKAGEPKAKGGEKKPGNPETKAGEKKDSKASENKDASAKDSKNPMGAQAQPKDAKGTEAKQANSKDAGKKDGAPPKAKEAGEAKGKQDPKSEAKTGEPKAKEKGNEDNKAGAKDAKKSPDAKQADAKDAGKDSKQAEAKAGDPKGDPKAGPKSSAKGQPMDPKDGGDPPQAKGDKNDKGDQQPPPPQAGNDKEPPIGKKQIQDAIDKMKQATKDIKDGKNNDATDKQEDAIQKLEQAKKELEKRLKILREEELERLLANLKTRLERMLSMQRDVLNNNVDGTIATFQAVQLNSDKKPTDPQVQASLRLAAKEKDIINEATKTVEILEGEGSSVAFGAAMQQVREDMKQVHRRLDRADVGIVTQDIEKDIIASLEDMVKAVEKKKDEMDKDKAKPKPPMDPKESGPPPDQKLLDQIAELKLIRAMQIQLNKRTELYSRQFPGQEQPADPNIRREIGELRDRQDRIYDITNKIQKGDNK